MCFCNYLFYGQLPSLMLKTEAINWWNIVYLHLEFKMELKPTNLGPNF
jgi:hypothetical protein